MDPKVQYTIDFEFGNLDLNWASYGQITGTAENYAIKDRLDVLGFLT